MAEKERPIIYTGGSFDTFHKGHVNFLRQCDRIGDVVVALNKDEFIKEFKGHPPIMTYEEREAVLRSCKYVNDVVPNEVGQDSKPTILKVKPDFIAIGTDWLGKDYYKQMGFTQEWLDQHDITLIYVPYTADISTTIIRERLKK